MEPLPQASEEQAKPKQVLGTLKNVEAVVNEYAKTVCHRYHVDPRYFEIMLAPQLDATMAIIGGPVVQIHLQWPEVKPIINTILGRAFELIKKYPIRRTMELVSSAYILEQKKERLKWRRENFSKEEDIVLDLLPRTRIKVVEKVTTILTDVQTGESIEVTKTSKSERFDGENVRMWMDLSRIVRDKYPPLEEVKDEDVGNG